MKIWNVGLLGYIEFELNFVDLTIEAMIMGSFKLKLIILYMMDSRRRTFAATGIIRLFKEN